MATQHTEYLNAKVQLREFANDVKKEYKGDRYLIAKAINDYCDSLLRDLRNQVSEKQYALYESWLPSFAADLHPK